MCYYKQKDFKIAVCVIINKKTSTLLHVLLQTKRLQDCCVMLPYTKRIQDCCVCYYKQKDFKTVVCYYNKTTSRLLCMLL